MTHKPANTVANYSQVENQEYLAEEIRLHIRVS